MSVSVQRDGEGGGGFDLGRVCWETYPGQGKQTGGFVYPSPIKRQGGGGVFKVPGTSTGDNHDMLLPAGSFVLNREASKFLMRQGGGSVPEPPSPLGFQEGNMVPVKTESNELVFGPKSWSSLIPVLNSVIPRFQSGGLVSHDHTGEGYNPNSGKDSQGRPVVFSKEAAAAFAKMMAEGGVNPKDVTSSKRSPAHNKRVGGVPNSNHLTGNAVDIHGPSKAWMKQNGAEYGWKWLDYGGHDGHFDFVKGMGSGKPPKEGKEEGVKGNKSGGFSMPQFDIGKLFSGVGGSISDMFSSVKGTIEGILSGGGMGMLALLGGGGKALLGGALGGSLFGGSPANAAMTDPTTKSPSSGGGGGDTVGSAPGITEGSKGLLDFIAHYESGGDYNKIFGGQSIDGLTNMTIQEVVDVQKKHLKNGFESAAIGRYQMMLPDVYAKKAGLSMDDKFSKENQDKMAMVYLEEDGWSKFKSGKMSADQFANNVAGTWAALPMPSGQSAHAGVGSNKSLVGRDSI